MTVTEPSHHEITRVHDKTAGAGDLAILLTRSPCRVRVAHAVRALKPGDVTTATDLYRILPPDLHGTSLSYFRRVVLTQGTRSTQAGPPLLELTGSHDGMDEPLLRVLASAFEPQTDTELREAIPDPLEGAVSRVRVDTTGAMPSGTELRTMGDRALLLHLVRAHATGERAYVRDLKHGWARVLSTTGSDHPSGGDRQRFDHALHLLTRPVDASSMEQITMAGHPEPWFHAALDPDPFQGRAYVVTRYAFEPQTLAELELGVP